MTFSSPRPLVPGRSPVLGRGLGQRESGRPANCVYLARLIRAQLLPAHTHSLSFFHSSSLSSNASRMSHSSDTKSFTDDKAGAPSDVHAAPAYEIDPAVERRVVRKLDMTVLMAFSLVFLITVSTRGWTDGMIEASLAGRGADSPRCSDCALSRLPVPPHFPEPSISTRLVSHTLPSLA
jgi:hypothetical protein